MQSLPLDGIILVTSPQDLAGMVVRKAANMAKHLEVPLLGLIENMSHIVCPQCGYMIEVFGPSRANETARLIDTKILGHIPIDPELTILCDEGSIEIYLSDEFEALAGTVIESVPAKESLPR
jgi:Mrp family chromosome partitioning ATPase